MDIKEQTIKDFGLEWQHYNQATLAIHKSYATLFAYFQILPFEKLRSEWVSGRWENMPLSAHKDRSFYTIQFDRLGSSYENRFTKQLLTEMLHAAGLENIKVNDNLPYWCAIGYNN